LVCRAAGCPGWPAGRLIPLGPADPSPLTARSFAPTGFDRVFGRAAVDGLFVESVLFERPVGDSFLDRELWSRARTPLPPETEAILAENGLRVTVLGGILPPKFQELIESETDAVHPHALTFSSRREAVVPTAGPHERCDFEVRTDLGGTSRAVRLEQARGGLLIRPSLKPSGVSLWCEPRVQHSERRDWIRPTADGTQFVVQGEVPVERYPELGFEVLLGADDYLVVGWPAGAEGTLGSALFAVEAGRRPRQRVLVIRAGWRGERPGMALPHPGRSGPPVAAQASGPGSSLAAAP
jgi:hypothetical protein